MFLSMKHALVSESDSALDKAAYQQLLTLVVHGAIYPSVQNHCEHPLGSAFLRLPETPDSG